MFQDDECFPNIKKRSHVLKFDQDYSNAEYIEAGTNYFGQIFKGYKESKEVCEWLSEIFGEDAILIRAAESR